MKKSDRESPYYPPEPAAPPRSAEPETLGKLVGDLMTRAREQAEAERAEAATRGPVTKFFLLLLMLAVLAAGATTVYGIVSFPDAPIRPSGGGYTSKTGAARTRQDYENYLAWSYAMWSTYPAAFLLAAVFTWSSDRDRRRRGGATGPHRPRTGGS
jgi:hypothetical protein